MSSSAEFDAIFKLPVVALEYRDLAGTLRADVAMSASTDSISTSGGRGRADVELSHQEFADRIKRERQDAAQQLEEKIRQEYETKLQNERNAVASTIRSFEVERIEYYARVEAEIVQLALAIAAKILHREAQVDPMLLASLVRIAIERIREGSGVTVRVSPKRAKQWEDYFASRPNAAQIEVKEDATLSDLDCLLETEMGVANFGLDSQLKEVEQGFFDLLALKPVSR